MNRDDRLRLAYAGLHPDRARSLTEKWGNARAVLRAVACGQVKASEAIRKRAGVPLDDVRAELTAARVRSLWRGDEGYPGHLADLPDAPDVLFVRGELPARPGVAIVGTRRASAYGRRLAHEFGAGVAAAGWPVVSGLARGVDGEAHRGCADAGGIGVGVLGSGPDVMYPPEHARLAAGLVDAGGAVVTEYPPGAPPEAWRFPPRNRIISGLAGAVVVVEAGTKGGALITAAAALAQGRSIYAVPGDIDRESSRGCNLLIRDGAHPVLDTDDLVTGLSFDLGPPPKVASEPVAGGHPLLDLLGPAGRSLEWLVERSELAAGEVLAQVSILEAEGKLTREGGLVWRAVARG